MSEGLKSSVAAPRGGGTGAFAPPLGGFAPHLPPPPSKGKNTETLRNGNNSFIIYLRVVILVSTPMFCRSRNPILPKQFLVFLT